MHELAEIRAQFLVHRDVQDQRAPLSSTGWMFLPAAMQQARGRPGRRPSRTARCSFEFGVEVYECDAAEFAEELVEDHGSDIARPVRHFRVLFFPRQLVGRQGEPRRRPRAPSSYPTHDVGLPPDAGIAHGRSPHTAGRAAAVHMARVRRDDEGPSSAKTLAQQRGRTVQSDEN